MGLEEIQKQIRDNRGTIRNYGVNKIGLFGSWVRGEQKPDSDIDMLVFFDPDKLTFDNYMDLNFFLEDLLHTNVDMLTPEQISPHIMPYIQKEILYESL
ncbi:MAG: nucleotidyltransferase family protein [Planctomycetota bacterium]|jgi:predicted nucleotidyltransferase